MLLRTSPCLQSVGVVRGMELVIVEKIDLHAG
jgi:hypothetical protein